jgi:hypothetical protein
MADELLGSNDYRIDVGDDDQCRYWSVKLGVTVAQIQAAVRQVGPIAHDVERYIRTQVAPTILPQRP